MFNRENALFGNLREIAKQSIAERARGKSEFVQNDSTILRRIVIALIGIVVTGFPLSASAYLGGDQIRAKAGGATVMFRFSNLPKAAGDASLTFRARGDLDGMDEYVDFSVEGKHVGAICKNETCLQCANAYQEDTTTVSKSDINSDGEITVVADATAAVSPETCPQAASGTGPYNHSVDVHVGFQFPENHAPQTEDITDQIREDGQATGILPGSDPDGDKLTYMITQDASNGEVTLNGDKVTYTPNADFNGMDLFKYRANDGFLNSNESTATITVVPVNDPPTWDSPPTPMRILEGTVGKELTFTAQASDKDTDDSVTYGLRRQPSGAQIDETRGTFSWTPDRSDIGSQILTITATDSKETILRTIDVEIALAHADTSTGGTGSRSDSDTGFQTGTGSTDAGPVELSDDDDERAACSLARRQTMPVGFTLMFALGLLAGVRTQRG